MLLRGRGIGADNGLTVGDSFSIDYGGGDLTGSDLTAAEQLNDSLPAGASGSSSSSSSGGGGFNFGSALSSITSIFGSASNIFGHGSNVSPQQLAVLQAQQAAARTNTLLIGGGLLLVGGLAFVALRHRRPAT